MKRFVALAIVCVIMASSAMADLFDFSFGSLISKYDGAGNFSASVNPDRTAGSVARIQVPEGVASFIAGQWGLGGDFSIAMTISNITDTVADGVGTFTIEDIDGDTITGNLTGDWQSLGGTANYFAGLLLNVEFNDNGTLDNSFDGHDGSISMNFIEAEPWRGMILELTTTSTWFDEGAFTTAEGSVDASVLPTAHPIITSPLDIIPRFSVYCPGELVTAQFSISNRGTEPIVLSVLTVGGRDPDGHVVDFPWEQDVTIAPGGIHNYIGDLRILAKTGIYQFFCAYKTTDGWNPSVPLDSGLTDDARAKALTVVETVIGPPQEYLFEAAHLGMANYRILGGIVEDLLTQKKAAVAADDPMRVPVDDAIVLAHRMQTEQRLPVDLVREGALSDEEDFWLLKVGGGLAGFLAKYIDRALPPFTVDGLREWGFYFGETLVLKNLGFVHMRQLPIGDLAIVYRSDRSMASVTYYGPNGGVVAMIPIRSRWVLSMSSIIEHQLYFDDSDSAIVLYKPADISAQIHSPGELRVYNSEGRVTGFMQGAVEEQIPTSMYCEDTETVIIVCAMGAHVYEVVGTGEGKYGLSIAQTEDEARSVFTASDIPVSNGSAHRYSVQTTPGGQMSSILEVDAEGDGSFEQTITAGSMLDNPQIALGGMLSISSTRPAYDRRTGRFSVNTTVQNTSGFVISSPIWLVIDSVSSFWVVPTPTSGTTEDGKPYIDLSSLAGDRKLSPGENVQVRVCFSNPQRQAFTFTASVRGMFSP